MVSLADLTLPASPEEVIYLTPPMIITITATMPSIPITQLRIAVILAFRVSVPSPTGLTSGRAASVVMMSFILFLYSLVILIVQLFFKKGNILLHNYIREVDEASGFFIGRVLTE